jgi:hypothetical protein
VLERGHGRDHAPLESVERRGGDVSGGIRHGVSAAFLTKGEVGAWWSMEAGASPGGEKEHVGKLAPLHHFMAHRKRSGR